VKVLADGKGRHLTDLEFIDSLAREQAEKAADEVAKADRAKAREDRKSAKAELEERWKQMKADHLHAVARWETQCATLTADGARKKDLPKKPKRAKEPQLEKVDNSDNESNGSGSE
jgi:phosphoenolpyruvate carboxylase